MKVTIFARSLKTKRRKSLYLIWSDGAKQHHELIKGLTLYDPKLEPSKAKSNKATNALAEQIRAKRQNELIANEYGIYLGNRSQDFIAYFEEKVRDVSWRATLNHLKAFAKDGVPIRSVSLAWCERFRSYLLTQVGASSANIYLSKINNCLNIAVKEGLLAKSPMQGMEKLKVKRSKKSFLEVEELQALVQTSCKSEAVRNAFLIGCFVGLRLSDIESLEWSDVIFKEGVPASVYKVQAKTRSAVSLPLTQSAASLLSQIHQTGQSKPFLLPSRPTIAKCLSEWVEDAGISKRITFHSSRHTYAMIMLKVGKDISAVSKLLGHSNLKTTQIYAQIAQEGLMDSVRRFPSFNLE